MFATNKYPEKKSVATHDVSVSELLKDVAL